MALFNYECDEVKRIIEEVSPNYPQLTTYEKEWLYFHKYGYIPGIPVGLEYETVSVNPTGMVSNAIPYQYKSAILKGNTMINIIGDEIFMAAGTSSITNITDLRKNYLIPFVKIDTNYLVMYELEGDKIEGADASNLVAAIGFLNHNSAWSSNFEQQPLKGKLILNSGDNPNYFRVVLNNKGYSKLKSVKINVIEYEEYMKDFDIPFFEGMKSVQMPTLTTSNEDGTKSNILTVNEDIELRGIDEVKDELDLTTGKMTQRTIQLPLSSDYFNFSRVNNSDQTNTIRWQLTFKDDFIANSIKVKSNGKCNIIDYYQYGGADKECIFIHPSAVPNRLQIKQLRTDTRFTTSEDLESFLLENQAYIVLELATESIKTVDLTPLNKPYEGTNHYELTSNIPCEAILEVPVVSTGKQTLEEINN